MLDERQFEDLKEIFPRSCCSAIRRSLRRSASPGRWSSTACRPSASWTSVRIHRQEADNPILDLAHALADPDLDFEDFERDGRAAAGATTGW
jgi:hypothetical protein